MPTLTLRFQTADVHDSLGRTLRFVRVADVAIARVNVESASNEHVVNMMLFADSEEVLGVLVRKVQSVVGLVAIEVRQGC